jgi:hypothetical protein
MLYVQNEWGVCGSPSSHCEVACALWNAIFSPFSLSWVMPLRVVDLFACWWTGGRSRSAVVFVVLVEGT